MAGHSHWKNIKRKKAVVDARRRQAWSKIARLAGENAEKLQKIVEGLEANDEF